MPAPAVGSRGVRGRRGPPEWAPLEDAFARWLAGEADASVTVYSDAGAPDPLRVAWLVDREPGPWERRVLTEARGSVLDVGAAGGALAAALEGAGHRVTALEILPSAVAAMRRRGLRDVRLSSLEGLAHHERYDTVVSFMNGTGLAGTLSRLPGFLQALADRTAAGGTILIDSTDPADWPVPEDGRAPGEVHLQLEGPEGRAPPLPWLYVSPATLAEAAAAVGLTCQVDGSDDEGRYLARLRRAALGGPRD